MRPAGGARALGGGGASGMHGEGTTQGCGGQGTREAHSEHAVHGRDLGRVEAERLVEHPRVLPSRRAGMRCGKRCGPGGVRALGGGDAIGMCTGTARLKAGRGRARAERTRNMVYMVVTLEVSQLEMSALTWRRWRRWRLPSVARVVETDQNRVYRKPSATSTHIPLSFPLYTHFVRGAAAVRPRLCSLGAIGASLVLSLPKPSFVFAHDRRRRASSAHSHTHSHMSIGTCQTAQPWSGCCAAPHRARRSFPIPTR
eukprot:scaffold10266_cov58-Phaeocystis_antarctica.AAC.3